MLKAVTRQRAPSVKWIFLCVYVLRLPVACSACGRSRREEREYAGLSWTLLSLVWHGSHQSCIEVSPMTHLTWRLQDMQLEFQGRKSNRILWLPCHFSISVEFLLSFLGRLDGGQTADIQKKEQFQVFPENLSSRTPWVKDSNTHF